MEFSASVACVLAVVVLGLTDASTLGLSGRGYTDQLAFGLGGVRGRSLGLGRVGRGGLNGCLQICPLGYTCSFGECVPVRSSVGVVGSRGRRVGGAFVRGGNLRGGDYGARGSFSTCGRMPLDCPAGRNDFNTAIKFTYRHDLQDCVAVEVCASCAHYQSRAKNLFDSRYECEKICYF